ncbi:MAG: hypothetical protein COU25_03130 [Candidatus Levybacteria bacterium CG10_big_fil_rev_8_21_14_0_10_35_13]|nr:MAG: hypothetical protein COU25_03130 [Candidatus Levybacteria bacterium CG10_big_fil_rev_8_21_14_0_10_35_13]
MRIIILGNGKWGTTLGSLLSENKKEFTFWELGTEITDNSIIVNCLPTQVMRKVLQTHGKNLKNFIFVNGAKGIEQKTHKIPYEITTDILGSNIDYFTLIGPGFAQEIVDKMPTLVNIGYVSITNSKFVQNLFQTDYFRIRLVREIKALEIAGGFKNVYAIACGIADGLGYGANTKTKLILVAMEEFYAFSKSMHMNINQDMLAGTIGDLILTCTSIESRNFSLGQMLVKKNVKSALADIGQTVEGFTTADSIPYFEKKSNLKLNLAHFVYDVIKADKSTDVKKRFLNFVKGV